MGKHLGFKERLALQSHRLPRRGFILRFGFCIPRQVILGWDSGDWQRRLAFVILLILNYINGLAVNLEQACSAT